MVVQERLLLVVLRQAVETANPLGRAALFRLASEYRLSNVRSISWAKLAVAT